MRGATIIAISSDVAGKSNTTIDVGTFGVPNSTTELSEAEFALMQNQRAHHVDPIYAVQMMQAPHPGNNASRGQGEQDPLSKSAVRASLKSRFLDTTRYIDSVSFSTK